jgi:drug/metabolite transporter (DMT)-like permease
LLTVTSLTEIRELAIRPPGWKALLACAYLSVFATALGYSIWYRALARRDSHRVGMTIMVQPVVGVPLAAWVLHETLGPSFLAGAALIAAGVYLAASSGAAASASPPS